MSNDSIRLDDAQWPLVDVAVLRAPTDEDVHAFVTRLEALAARRDAPFVIVLDARAKARLSKQQRKLVAQAFERGPLKQHVRAEAVLLGSRVVAALGRAFLRLRRPALRMGAFAVESEARAWALAQARR